MQACIRCGFGLDRDDQSIRILMLCCISSQKICPGCLLDFADEHQDKVVHQCEKCSKKIKVSTLCQKYNLYRDVLNRSMISSRLIIQTLERAYQTSNPNLQGEWFGPNGYQSQEPIPNIRHYRQGNMGAHQCQQQGYTHFDVSTGFPNTQDYDAQSNLGASMMQNKEIRKCNLREEELGLVGRKFFQQGKIATMSSNSVNLGPEPHHYGMDMSHKMTVRNQMRQSSVINGHYPGKTNPQHSRCPQRLSPWPQHPEFDNGNYSYADSKQRSVSSNSRVLGSHQRVRPLSGHWRNKTSELSDQKEKSPPSFGKSKQSGLMSG